MNIPQNKYIRLMYQSYEHMVNAAKPQFCLPDLLPPPPPHGKAYVIGAGKASAEMARVFETNYSAPFEGAVVTRYGHSVPTQKIKILEASHPVPDQSSLKAVHEIIHLLKKATPDDLIIFLLSGGGSALLTAPIENITFDELIDLNKQLLKSGAEIQEINTIRKHLNKVLGGKLAQYVPNTRMITLAISDVIGDLPSVIASGPTVGDETTLHDCISIAEKYDLNLTNSICKALKNSENETPAPDNPIFVNKSYHLIATPQKSMDVAEKFWKKNGFSVLNLGADIGGDTNEQAIYHAKKALSQEKAMAPLAIISGGETTVKIKGNGKGGPNTQFALQTAIYLKGQNNIYAMACDTDGIDGSENNAGAYITPETWHRSQKQNLNALKFLDQNDSYSFFKELDSLVITGPTYTNVNDYRVILIVP